MRLFALSVLVAIGLGVSAAPAASQETVAEQKARADLAKVQLDTAAAAAKLQYDAIAQLRSVTGNSATATGQEASVEGVLLMRRAYKSAAEQLAKDLGPKLSGRSLMVLMTTNPPSIADWLAFQKVASRAGDNLKAANSLWFIASQAPPKGPKMAFVPPLAGVAVLASVADLFTVDTTLAGVASKASDGQLETQIYAAFQAQGVALDSSSLRAMTSTAQVDSIVDGMAGDVAAARKNYGAYLDAVRLATKDDPIPPAKAIAGKNLETALADYDLLYKTMYTSVAGTLPAAVVSRQAALSDSLSTRSVLYIRENKGSASVRTKKGFFVGWFGAPVSVRGSAALDYELVGQNAEPLVVGSVTCLSGYANVEDISTANPSFVCESTPP